MPVAKTVTLYSFEELDTQAQDSIISAYVQDLPGWWSDDVEGRTGLTGTFDQSPRRGI